MHEDFHQGLLDNGVLSRRQHPALIGRIDAAVKRGALVPLMPGTYAPEKNFHTLVWSIADWDPDAVFTSGTAARLTWWPDIRCDDVHALTRRRPRRRVAGTRLSQTPLHLDLITDVGRLRLQHQAASTVDLARVLGPDAIDEALRRRATSVRALQWALERMPGRLGNPRVAALIRDSRDEPWSALERRAHRELRTAGIKGWRTNHQIRVPWGWVYADIAFLTDRVIVELDGWAFHQSRESFVADRRRDVALQIQGWTVLRFTADTIEEMVPQLRRRLSAGRRAARRKSAAG